MTVAELSTMLMRRKKLSVRQATKVTLAATQWAIAADRIGHFPSIAEFQRWSGESPRTVERRSSLLRSVFSEDELREVVAELGSPHIREAAPGGRRGSGGPRAAHG